MMITYTPSELREAIELASKAKNTDDLPPYVWSRAAKVLLAEVGRLRAEVKRLEYCLDINDAAEAGWESYKEGMEE